MKKTMIMPFGKYKGMPVSGLSYGYCDTLLANVPIKDQELKEALEEQRLEMLNHLNSIEALRKVYSYDYDFDSEIDFGDLC